MFISNNRPPFRLRWKEKLVKQQKVSKYYETDCRSFINCLYYLNSHNHKKKKSFLFFNYEIVSFDIF